MIFNKKYLVVIVLLCFLVLVIITCIISCNNDAKLDKYFNDSLEIENFIKNSKNVQLDDTFVIVSDSERSYYISDTCQCSVKIKKWKEWLSLFWNLKDEKRANKIFRKYWCRM